MLYGTSSARIPPWMRKSLWMGTGVHRGLYWISTPMVRQLLVFYCPTPPPGPPDMPNPWPGLCGSHIRRCRQSRPGPRHRAGPLELRFPCWPGSRSAAPGTSLWNDEGPWQTACARLWCWLRGLQSHGTQTCPAHQHWCVADVDGPSAAPGTGWWKCMTTPSQTTPQSEGGGRRTCPPCATHAEQPVWSQRRGQNLRCSVWGPAQSTAKRRSHTSRTPRRTRLELTRGVLVKSCGEQLLKWKKNE